MTQCHDNPAAGHFGLFKTLHLVSRTFWWPKLRQDVQSYVNSCVRCRQAKTATGAPPGLLQPLPTPERPWGAVSMDFLTCLPVSAGFTTVLVVVDMLTKMTHFIPCRRIPTAKVTAQLFIQHIFRLHGLPDRVVSDRGSQFTAQFWKELMSALQVQVCLASTHHPETDGGTEKVIGILEQYLRCFAHDRQSDWSKYLAVAEFAFNNSQHTSTQTTPFLANYGYHPRFFPLSLLDSPVPMARDYLVELQSVHELVKRSLDKAKADYKRFADRSRRDTPPLAVGDCVWLSTKHLSSETPRRKLDQRFLGPFPVERVINPVTYRLTLPSSFRVHPVFHRSLLVPVGPSCSLRSPEAGPVFPRTQVRVPRLTVSRIRDSRWLKNRFQYLVEWSEGGPDDCCWVNAMDFDAPDLVLDFHVNFPDKPHPFRQTRGKGPAGGDSVVSGPCLPWLDDEEEPAAGPSGSSGPAPLLIESDKESEEEFSWEWEEASPPLEGQGAEGGLDVSMGDEDSEGSGGVIGRWQDARYRRAKKRESDLFGKRK